VMFIVSTVVWWWCMFLYWGALARRINDMGGAGSVAGLAFVVTIVQDLSLHFPLFSPLVMPLILLFINLYLMVAGLYGFVCSFIPSKMVENKYGPVPFCD
ncbi:MAG: hypothetical protein Q4F99_01795, partial [bacterium]|nr:hypothetical protein [bacterium]